MSIFPSFSLTSVLVTVIVMIVIVLVIREAMCWYWKINARFDLQREMRDLLQQIEKNTRGNIIRDAENDLKVGDKVRLTDDKLEQLKQNMSPMPAQTFGDITAIDEYTADVRFGSETHRVELKNLLRI